MRSKPLGLLASSSSCAVSGRPSAAYTVWYDPADPARVTAFGPGYWLMIALAFGVALVGLFGLCIDLARL